MVERWVWIVAAVVVLGLAGCCPDGGGYVDEAGVDPSDNSDNSGGDDAPAGGIEGNRTIKSFEAAKRRLPAIFEGHEETFYCGCTYEDKEVNLKSCGYKPRKNKERASRIEWEHVVPAQAFGQSFKAWREGDAECVDSKGESYKGRECAGKVSDDFKRMEADLYNLRPAIGEVNGDRGNASMAMLEGEAREYGACDVEIDFGENKVEPREEIRGDVARTYLYMDRAYPGRGIVSRKNKPLFEAWSKADPPDAWEKQWAKRVEEVQGNRNPFIR